MNETEANGTYEFSEFVYFVDLPYIEAEKEKHDDHEEEEKDDDSELRSIVTQIVDVIVQLVKWVAKKLWGRWNQWLQNLLYFYLINYEDHIWLECMIQLRKQTHIKL